MDRYTLGRAGDRRIEWTAQQGKSGPNKNGTLWLIHEELCQLEQEAACEELRSLVEIEVVPHMEEIGNLNEALNEQIPEVVQRIILRNSET
ncbi:MAG: hypothetical protein ACTSSE_10060 [Candidatus Thorarchaeota archaeon]